MSELTITLRQILTAKPCYDPRERGLLPTDWNLDEPIPVLEVVRKVEIFDTLWCLELLPQTRPLVAKFALDCANRVRHLMPNPHSIAALDVAQLFLAGKISQEEMVKAGKNAALAACIDSPEVATTAENNAACAAACAAEAALATATEEIWPEWDVIDTMRNVATALAFANGIPTKSSQTLLIHEQRQFAAILSQLIQNSPS